MSTQLSELIKKARPILKSAGVTRSAVFGSYARGEDEANSDIDILVELPKDKGLLDFIGLKQDLEDTLGIEVDLVSYNGIHPMLKKSILANQINIL